MRVNCMTIVFEHSNSKAGKKRAKARKSTQGDKKAAKHGRRANSKLA